MTIQFVDLKKQYSRLQDKIDARIKAVLTHGQFIMGPEISELEEKLADYVGVKHCISCASGTDALLIAMLAMNIKEGDEVITTPFSFFATAEMILLLGAKPVFVDIDPDTYNLDAQLLESAITESTRAIVPVSLYGQCADFTAINEVAKQYSIPVIEDAAQSFGATHNGTKSCGLSDVAGTSFFPSKPLGAYGDGGACFTNNDLLAETMRQLRVHGQDRRYNHPLIGINGRLDTIQAAVLLVKLEVFAEEVEFRKEIGSNYTQLLDGTVKTPTIADGNTSVYAQYTIEVSNRDTVVANLAKQGIPTSIHYPTPLHLQPSVNGRYIALSPLGISESSANRVLSLPMHPYLTPDDQSLIVEAVKSSLI